MNKNQELSYSFPASKENQKLANCLNLNNLEESLHYPLYFEIETVNACNAECVMCSVKKWEKRDNVIMTDAMFAEFVRDVSQYKDWIKVICLNRDGEPTLDKKLSNKVKMLKDVGIEKVTFSTNGQLLTPALVNELIDAGLDDIMVSIDAVTKRTFEAIRVGLDYDTVLKNTIELIRIRGQKDSKMSIRLRMMVMKENRHELNEWFDFWRPKVCKTDRVYAKPIHTWGNEIDIETKDMVEKYVEDPCSSLFSTMVVRVDGSVPLCSVDYNIRYAMGNFPSQSIKEIWNGKKYLELRRLHANKKRNKIDKCRGCHIWDRSALITG